MWHMDPEVVSLLANPLTREPLRLVGGALIGPDSNAVFPVRQGIPVFLDQSRVTGLNRRYQRLYDRLAPFYDFPYKIYDLLTRGGVGRVRAQYLKELEIKDNDLVLEVSIGTGANLPYLPPAARYFGLDISWGMLKKCQKNLAKWRRRAELFLGEAEKLPFKDHSFDSIFHMGGINFFNDRAGAIREMIRVAKPGTKILIVDETGKYARARYNRPGPIAAPVALIPGEMAEINFEEISGGRLWRLTFRKPSATG